MSINVEATIRWKGYDPNELSVGSNSRIWAVCDGCGWGRWVRRRSYSDLCSSCCQKGKTHSTATRLKMGLAARSRPPITDATRKNISNSKQRAKSPLPNGWEILKGPITKNKECSDYLGCYIAERLLSKIYPDVQVMPHGNPGYDFSAIGIRRLM